MKKNMVSSAQNLIWDIISFSTRSLIKIKNKSGSDEVLQNKSGPDEVLQNKSGPDEVLQNKSGSDEVLQNKSGPDEVLQNKSVSDEVLQNKSGPDSISSKKDHLAPPIVSFLQVRSLKRTPSIPFCFRLNDNPSCQSLSNTLDIYI